jgi:hypothetical protein
MRIENSLGSGTQMWYFLYYTSCIMCIIHTYTHYTGKYFYIIDVTIVGLDYQKIKKIKVLECRNPTRRFYSVVPVRDAIGIILSGVWFFTVRFGCVKKNNRLIIRISWLSYYRKHSSRQMNIINNDYNYSGHDWIFIILDDMTAPRDKSNWLLKSFETISN